MKRFLILTKALFFMHLRNGSVLFWNFAFPVLLMFIYGLIMSQYMNYMTPGVIVLNTLSFGLVGSSTMMLEMREKGVLRRLQRSVDHGRSGLFVGADVVAKRIALAGHAEIE